MFFGEAWGWIGANGSRDHGLQSGRRAPRGARPPTPPYVRFRIRRFPSMFDPFTIARERSRLVLDSTPGTFATPRTPPLGFRLHRLRRGAATPIPLRRRIVGHRRLAVASRPSSRLRQTPCIERFGPSLSRSRIGESHRFSPFGRVPQSSDPTTLTYYGLG